MFLYSLYTRVQIAFASPATVAFACAPRSWLPRHISAQEVIRPLHGCARRQHCLPGTGGVTSLAQGAYTTLAHPCITN